MNIHYLQDHECELYKYPCTFPDIPENKAHHFYLSDFNSFFLSGNALFILNKI